MRVLICNCHDSIKLPKIDLGADVNIEYYDNLCKIKPQIVSDEKVVIAGCSPNLLEGLFPNINAEFVNILEHVSLVSHPPEKVVQLISAAVAKMNVTKPIEPKIFQIKDKNALVIGGGIAGIEVAAQLSRSGVSVTLIEQTPFLGGTVAKLDRLYPEGTPHSHTLMPLRHKRTLCSCIIPG